MTVDQIKSIYSDLKRLTIDEILRKIPEGGNIKCNIWLTSRFVWLKQIYSDGKIVDENEIKDATIQDINDLDDLIDILKIVELL